MALHDAPLGKSSEYPEHYDPTLLFPVARQENRRRLGLDDGRWPWFGEDLWQAWEVSWLRPGGVPAVAWAEIHVPADSPSIIESKSLKHYLWSYRDEGVFHEHFANLLLDDLVAAIEPRWCRVEVTFNARGGIGITVSADHGAFPEAAY